MIPFAENLSLPEADAATQVYAVMGRRGSGLLMGARVTIPSLDKVAAEASR